MARVGISLQVAISMALVAIFVTFAVGEYERRAATQRLALQLNEQANLTVSLVSGLLVEAIIVEDTPVLETAIQTAIDRNPTIFSIRLSGVDGAELARARSSLERQSYELQVFERAITFEGETFGTLMVEWSTREGLALIEQNVRQARLTTILTVATLSLLFLGLISGLVTRPLSRIQARMTEAAGGQISRRYVLPWFVSRELRVVDQSVTLLEEAFSARDEREEAIQIMADEKSEADARERKLILASAEKDKKAAEEQAKIAQSERRQLELIEEFNASVNEIVELAAHGDLSSRLVLEFENEGLAQTSISINRLLDNIASSLSATRVSLDWLASGKLTERMTGEFSGVFEDLQSNVNTTFETLAQVINQISSSGGSVSNAAVGIENSAHSLSGRTMENAAKLQQTLAAIDEIASTFQSISGRASAANSDATDVRKVAQNGLAVTQSAMASMDNINNASQKVEGSIGSIQDIAAQIRMLAINARIEASRAGEFGRGFSVIAAEVGSLAQRSSEAVEEIDTVLQETLSAIGFGVNQVTDMGVTIEEIVTSTNNILDQMGEISGDIKPQSDRLTEIKTALDAIGRSTLVDTEICDDLTSAIEKLRHGSGTLETLIARFEVGEDREQFASSGDSKTIEKIAV